ncbi:MAG: ABC transporter ATP-binding protein [Clostridiales bacterium]|nr:ABC transporter ATP-binding protein [Clostridiales bacterium]MDD4018869.1 ABC transporter ATP-binding protein [Kiritimatiellia bacterium]
MIQFENVCKHYGSNVVVDRLNLDVEQGNLVTLIGASGCGKTTTLKMVNRIIEPTSGKIIVNGENVLKQDPVQLRRGIGYVIQQIGLFPNMTISENITVVGQLLGWSKSRMLSRAEELLSLVDMEPAIYMNRYPNELSGGQQQRIGVLRALAADPETILMDEPFGALDPITRDQLQNEFKNLQTQLHKTILFVTHDMDEALKMADTIVLMRDGKLVQAASPEDMLRNPADDYVVNFIGLDRTLRSPDEVLVEESMIPDPVTIEINRGLAEGLERMRKRRVDSLLVVSHDKILSGIVTIKDLQQNLAKGGRIGDVMSKDPTTIHIGNTVREAVLEMARTGVGYLPVIDDHNKLKGLITRASLVNVLSDVLWSNPEAQPEGSASDRAKEVQVR